MIHVTLPKPQAVWDERVVFACLPVADCLLALHLLARQHEGGSEAGSQRLFALRAALTPEQQRESAALFGIAFPFGALAFPTLHALPDARDPVALIAAIRALPDVAIVAHALTCGGTLLPDAPLSPGVLRSLADDPAWAREYVRRFLHPAPADAEQIVAVVLHPARARQRLALLLDDLFRTVFVPVLPALLAPQREADARMRAAFTRDPAAFVAARLPDTEDGEGQVAKLVVWPSAYLGAGWATIPPLARAGSPDGAVHSIAYGTETLPEPAAPKQPAGAVMPEIAPQETYQEVYRLLADPARWALIRLLVARPCYGQELAELLGLSIATVSHHLNGLKRLDLVRIERAEHRLYYHLRTDRLRALLAGAEQGLLES